MLIDYVRGTTVSDTGLRILGFPILWGSILDIRLSVLEVEGCLTEAVANDNPIRPGGVILRCRPYIWARGACDKKVRLTRVCTKCVTYWYRFFMFCVSEGL